MIMRSSSEQHKQSPITEYRILALYRFLPLITPQQQSSSSSSWDEPPERHPQLLQLQSELYATLRRYETRGTLLIAPEGINGTICYPFPPPTAATDSGDDSGDDVDKYDGQDDPVKAFISNHPLFGGEGLRTRSSVWKEHDSTHHDDHVDSNDDDNTTNNSSNSRPQQAFQRLKIKIKPEIVTLGLGRPITNETTNKPTPTQSQQRHLQNQLANPNITKGTYLNPRQWDNAMKDPNVLVIDTRNSYEIDIGTFESAVDPKTRYFSEFPDYLARLAKEYDWDQDDGDVDVDEGRVEQHHQVDSNDDGTKGNEMSDKETTNNNNNTPTSKKKPPPTAIALFCTGGIRCEKATSYALQSNLFPQHLPIYHLEGGILSYLDDVAKRDKITKEGETATATTVEGETAKGEEVLQHGSTFHGECFVFDKRVALTEGLEPSNKYVSCHGCRGPMDRRLLLEQEVVTDDDDGGGGGEASATTTKCDDNNDDNACNDDNINNNKFLQNKKKEYKQLLMGIRNIPPLTYDTTTQRWYVPGLTCPRCHDGTTRESFERFAQRREQMEICAREGRSHFQDNGRK